jgi:hypothetical protein
MTRFFKINYLHPETRQLKSFKIKGEDIETIRINTIAKLKKRGVNTDLINEWEVEEITKSKKYFSSELVEEFLNKEVK